MMLTWILWKNRERTCNDHHYFCRLKIQGIMFRRTKVNQLYVCNDLTTYVNSPSKPLLNQLFNNHHYSTLQWLSTRLFRSATWIQLPSRSTSLLQLDETKLLVRRDRIIVNNPCIWLIIVSEWLINGKFRVTQWLIMVDIHSSLS